MHVVQMLDVKIACAEAGMYLDDEIQDTKRPRRDRDEMRYT